MPTPVKFHRCPTSPNPPSPFYLHCCSPKFRRYSKARHTLPHHQSPHIPPSVVHRSNRLRLAPIPSCGPLPLSPFTPSSSPPLPPIPIPSLRPLFPHLLPRSFKPHPPTRSFTLLQQPRSRFDILNVKPYFHQLFSDPYSFTTFSLPQSTTRSSISIPAHISPIVSHGPHLYPFFDLSHLPSPIPFHDP